MSNALPNKATEVKAIEIMDLALTLAANNGLRPIRSRATLTDWIIAVSAAMQLQCSSENR